VPPQPALFTSVHCLIQRILYSTRGAISLATSCRSTLHFPRNCHEKEREMQSGAHSFLAYRLWAIVLSMKRDNTLSGKGDTMKGKGLWFSALALGALLTLSPAAHAGGWPGLRFGPPPPRHEVVVARPGHVWVAGHWGWNHVRYVWLPGRWVARRPGYFWVNGVWFHRHDGWAYREGYWRRR
jgi:hypothetical protein